MLDHIRENRLRMLGSFSNANDIIVKSKGEGSKGGKVIGHTKSGKAIYEKFDHPSHDEFSPEDHSDAVDAHSTAAFKAERDSRQQKFHRQQANEHDSMSKVKAKKEGEKKDDSHYDTGEGAHAKKPGTEEKKDSKPEEKKAEPKDEKKDQKPEKKEEKPVDKGKSIGKTKSGKEVFNNLKADAKEYKDFDSKDHREAADLHHQHSQKPGHFPPHHRSLRNSHHDAAIKSGQKEEKDAVKSQPSAGDKLTTKDGVAGDVKHRDDTHTYIEHKTEDGKTRVSKVKNEDVDAKIKAGHFTHHKPTNVKKDDKDIKKSEEGAGKWDPLAIVKANQAAINSQIADTFFVKGDIQNTVGNGYGPGNEAIKFVKTGAEIREKIPAILSILTEKRSAMGVQMAVLKTQIGIEPSETTGSGENITLRYPYRMCDAPYDEASRSYADLTDQNKWCQKYNDLMYQYQDIDADVKVLTVMTNNLEDKKKYELTCNQLVALHFK